MSWIVVGQFLLKHWLKIVLLALIAASVTYIRHQGFEAGIASREQEVEALTQMLDGTLAASEGWKVLADARGAELAKRDAADALLARAAEEAVSAAEAKEREANKALDYALRQLADATRKPECKRILDMDLAQCGL